LDGNGPERRLAVNKYLRENQLHVGARKRSPGMAKVNVKGKAGPLQAWTGPEGSRRLRLPDFKTINT
jgi:hypothetical protein